MIMSVEYGCDCRWMTTEDSPALLKHLQDKTKEELIDYNLGLRRLFTTFTTSEQNLLVENQQLKELVKTLRARLGSN